MTFVAYLAMSIIDLAALGEARLVRTELEAAENALYESAARNIGDIAEH